MPTNVRIYFGHEFLCSYDVPYILELAHMQLNVTLALSSPPSALEEIEDECKGPVEVGN